MLHNTVLLIWAHQIITIMYFTVHLITTWNSMQPLAHSGNCVALQKTTHIYSNIYVYRWCPDVSFKIVSVCGFKKQPHHAFWPLRRHQVVLWYCSGIKYLSPFSLYQKTSSVYWISQMVWSCCIISLVKSLSPLLHLFKLSPMTECILSTIWTNSDKEQCWSNGGQNFLCINWWIHVSMTWSLLFD